MISSTWIHFDEKSGKWQVKRWDGGPVVLKEFRTRSQAFAYSAWSIDISR